MTRRTSYWKMCETAVALAREKLIRQEHLNVPRNWSEGESCVPWTRRGGQECSLGVGGRKQVAGFKQKSGMALFTLKITSLAAVKMHKNIVWEVKTRTGTECWAGSGQAEMGPYPQALIASLSGSLQSWVVGGGGPIPSQLASTECPIFCLVCLWGVLYLWLASPLLKVGKLCSSRASLKYSYMCL